MTLSKSLYSFEVLTPPDATALARFETGNIIGDPSCITREYIEVSTEFNFYDNGGYPIERFCDGSNGFLAFDEIFGSQDEERRIQIMEAFHTISESSRLIFLISHETEIKEMFERVIEL